MPTYKCPACGRSNIDIPQSESADSETLTMPSLKTEIRCKDCGWFGSLEELKVGH